MKNSLSEEDLVSIFSIKERSKRRTQFLFDLLYKFIIFIFLVSASYITINFRAFAQKFDFWFKNDFQTVKEENLPAVPAVPTLEEEKRNIPLVLDNYINIPAIGVNAPITFRVNNQPKEVSIGLENGVIQINGTSLPGEQGNVYITGHSSNYIWAKGSYNSIFALLDKMVIGDMIYIKFGGTVYEYHVFDKKVVLPTDLSVMSPTNDSRLTLVTCWPVGTSLKRMIILANQTYPDPESNKANENTTGQFDRLPSGR